MGSKSMQSLVNFDFFFPKVLDLHFMVHLKKAKIG